ncbi:hypothetical protein AB9R79_22710, partial [Vibrio splendidus]
RQLGWRFAFIKPQLLIPLSISPSTTIQIALHSYPVLIPILRNENRPRTIHHKSLKYSDYLIGTTPAISFCSQTF